MDKGTFILLAVAFGFFIVGAVLDSELINGTMLGVIALIVAIGGLLLAAVTGNVEMNTGFAITIVGLLLAALFLNSGALTGETAMGQVVEQDDVTGTGVTAACGAGFVAGFWIPGTSFVTAPLGCIAAAGTYILW